MTKQARFQKPVIQNILNAAEELFAEKGFAATRVDEVAARAAVVKSHLYYHFSSKDQLLTDLVQWRIGQILLEKETLLADVSMLTPDVVHTVLQRAILGLLQRHQAFVRIALRECLSSSATADTLFQAVRVLLDDARGRFTALGYQIDPQHFALSFYYFGLLPAAMHSVAGEQWARANGMTLSEAHVLFLHILTQLETTFLQQHRSS